ncbi:hypothetical protein LARI1_G002453 [Lachnellula arida]|uniref:Aminoglycoside phosphotransferase domain-containing protein n=1 Tax=Lachnellula arida TaxID=1316785 RepID=A0A8T9BKU3_9HELO|nr:hypothetical protein LARI1_G002453 [Lachnellula arida]
MTTPEVPTLEPNSTIQQDLHSDTVMTEPVDATMVGIPDVVTRDPEEITTQDEKISDAGSDVGSADSSDDKEDNESIVATEDGEGDATSDAGGDEEDESGEQEGSFETYKLKVAQLSQDLGLGEPLKVDEMKSGGFNDIVGLTIPLWGAPRNPTPDLILRISQFMDESDSAEFLDQIAITSWLSRIMGYDSTENNALGNVYVLQERLPGVPAADIFYTLPLAEKLQITTLVAETLTKLESIKFDRPGRLAAKFPLPGKLNGLCAPVKEIDIAPYRHNPTASFPAVEQQPLPNYFATLFEIQKKKDWVVASKIDRLMEIAKEMESVGFMRTTDTDNVLWHWDFSASNFMLHRLDTAKLVDVENHIPSHGCQHKVEIKVDNEDTSSPRHTIQVEVEDNSGRSCKHKIEVSVEHSSGKKYRHTINISEEARSGGSAHTIKSVSSPLPDSNSGQWVLGGVLDWDDVLSVPRVLARKPPSWLWCDEEDRVWSQNRDEPPLRDLTQDELLIKAHFDQLMEKASPGYLEDTYHRGIWLRRLARFALEGFEDGEAYKRYDIFVKEWYEYSSWLGKGIKTNV